MRTKFFYFIQSFILSFFPFFFHHHPDDGDEVTLMYAKLEVCLFFLNLYLNIWWNIQNKTKKNQQQQQKFHFLFHFLFHFFFIHSFIWKQNNNDDEKNIQSFSWFIYVYLSLSLFLSLNENHNGCKMSHSIICDIYYYYYYYYLIIIIVENSELKKITKTKNIKWTQNSNVDLLYNCLLNRTQTNKQNKKKTKIQSIFISISQIHHHVTLFCRKKVILCVCFFLNIYKSINALDTLDVYYRFVFSSILQHSKCRNAILF